MENRWSTLIDKLVSDNSPGLLTSTDTYAFFICSISVSSYTFVFFPFSFFFVCYALLNIPKVERGNLQANRNLSREP